MNTAWLNDWNDIQESREGKTHRDALLSDFGITEAALDGYDILLASYSYYLEGIAFVLLEKNNVLYEVNATHCSCFELKDNKWEPEETSIVALRHRLVHGGLGKDGSYDVFASALRSLLDSIDGVSP